MNRFTKFTAAALVAVLTFTACDEGTPPPVEPPPPPTPVGTISGSVTIEGTAASGVTATLSSGATTTTGSGGNFAFSGVEAGTYTVTISGFPEDATFAQVTQSATIATDGQNVQLNFAGEYVRSSAVVGNVVAADAMMSGGDGQPETLAGVTVTLDGEHAMGETMETDMSGGFAFTGLRAGTYTVTISDYPEDVSFETVNVEVEVEVGEVGQADFTGHFIRTSAVEGQVVIEGEGLAGVTVTLSGGPADESYTVMTDADGMYQFEDLRPGDYTVSISDFDTRDYEFAATSQDVSVDLDETGTVSFTGVLLRTSGISGRVSVAGMGLPGIAVTLSGAADDSTMTDEGGQYSFAGLAAGDYTVTIAVESDAYVFDSMSQDRTVGDDDPQIVNFEGAHAMTASVSGMLFLDELDKNDAHDAGEHPLAHAGIPLALVGPGVNDQRLSATGPDGSFMFPNLQAGPYQLVVPVDATVAAALAANDVKYGGPGTGYAFDLAVGESKTQAIPFDITHTTVNFSVSLRSGEDTGDALPGATVSLYADDGGEDMVGSGETDDDGMASIKVARADASGNMVYAGVMAADYDVADEMTAVEWDPQAFAAAAANDFDVVNLNVNVSVSGATVSTDLGGGVELAGWSIDVTSGDDDVDGAPTKLDDDGMASLETTVDEVPATFAFSVADDQDNDLDGGESYEASGGEYVHTGLQLAGPQNADDIVVTYTTQTLKLYVHHERDQVRGYTGSVQGGDRRMSGMVDVEIRYVAANGRTRTLTSDMWDAGKNSKDDKKGGLTYTGLPADMNIIATGRAAENDVMLSGLDQLAAYEDFDENGVEGGAFGDQGGFHHTVELCPLTATDPTGQDHGECASFAFVNTYTVDGQAWKHRVKMDSGDGFTKVEEVGVAGTEVTLDPVAGKNLEGDSEAFEAAEKDDKDTKDLDETKQFDFGRMADGVYELGIPSGWVATGGAGGDELDDEFLLANVLTGDKDEDDADDHLNIDVTPSTGYLYGRVVDGSGLPAEGVTVDVNGETAETDDEGRYIVEGYSKRRPPRKPVLVTISGAGYASFADSSISFAANMPVEADDFMLTGTGAVATFSGSVTEAAGGDPVSGVEIRVTDGNLINANAKSSGAEANDIYKTGADGAYSVQVEADGGRVTLTAHKKGMSFQPATGYTFTASANTDIGPLPFTASAHGAIAGRVVNADGGPEQYVKIIATPTGGGSAASDVSSSTGAFSINVPQGAYTLSGEDGSGYTLEFPNGQTVFSVIAGQTQRIGNVKATVSGDRPPRFTSSSRFSYESGTGESIGTVKATDPDNDDHDVEFSGGSDEILVIPSGALVWAGTPPTYDSKVADNNVKKATVTATGDGTNTSMQNITVTVTASGDAVVTLVVTPDEIVEGGTSTVTATLKSATSSPFSVTVATATDNDRVHNVSANKTLFFAVGSTRSSGTPVTITSVNDNVHTGEETVTVSGTTTASGLTIEDAELTVTDDDVPNGRVTLVLAKSRIDETDDTGTTAVSENVDTLTATVVGGTPFDTEVSIAVVVSPAGVVTPADIGGDPADGHQLGTLTIPAGSRSSTLLADGNENTTNAEIVITAVGDDQDAGHTVVRVSGTATAAGDDVPKASQPETVNLTIFDDDTAPGAPEGSSVSGVTTDGFTLSWEAPSGMGELNGTAGASTNITYEVRYTTTAEANDPTTTDGEWNVAWAPQTTPHAVTGASLVAGRGYTVQLRTVLTVGSATLNSSSVTKAFTVPSS